MSNDNEIAMLAAGVGGGFLLWHVLKDKKPAQGAPGTSTPTTTTAPSPNTAGTPPNAASSSAAAPAIATSQAPPPSASSSAATPATATTAAPAACSLRLDVTGLTANGSPIAIADVVTRCKAAGKADVVVAQNAPATTYADLMTAFGNAGISVYSHRNTRRNARRTAAPKVGDHVRLADHVRTIPAYDGKPAVLHDTVLRVVTVNGRGTKRSPRVVEVTDGDRIWHLDADDLVREPGRQAREAHSSTFILAVYAQGDRAAPRLRYYQTERPISWEDARERLVAADLIDPSLHLQTRAPGRRLLTNGPHLFRADKAQALPDPLTFTEFTLLMYPSGLGGGSTRRWFRSEPPVTRAEARDRLVAAGIVDRALDGRTSRAGGWTLGVGHALFRADQAEPLPGGDDEDLAAEPERQARASVDLAAFAWVAQRSASQIEEDPTPDGLARGRFGPRKVFIAAVYRALRSSIYRDLPRATFDHLLLRAHRAGFLELARADLMSAMDPTEVRESEVTDPRVGSRFHFVISERTRDAEGGGAFQQFTLAVYADADQGPPRVRWFYTDQPVAWEDARDRLVAARVVYRSLYRRIDERGGWILAVDPGLYRADRAEPLP